MSIYYNDDTVTLHEGNCMTVLPTLPTGSVDCIVTSPPYFGLRDYGHPDQHGLEESPAQYVETMRSVFAECRRVLADDGTLWLNLGDSYHSGRGNPGPNAADTKQPARRGWVRPVDRPGQAWAAPKNLLGIPWRVAFALQDDGWILRNAIVWHKLNRMPESVRDRLATAHEYVFLFSESRRYFFNLDAIREPLATQPTERRTQRTEKAKRQTCRASRCGSIAAVGSSGRRQRRTYHQRADSTGPRFVRRPQPGRRVRSLPAAPHVPGSAQHRRHVCARCEITRAATVLGQSRRVPRLPRRPSH